MSKICTPPVAEFDEWYKKWEPESKRIGGEGFGNPYFYPPFVAASLSPISSVDAKIWRNVLFSINIILIFVNAWFVLFLTGVARNRRNILWCIALVLLCYPMSRATKLGQIVPLLAALTWFGLLWLRDEKQRLAGLMLGFVGAVKLFPIGIVALPFITRRWKTVYTALLVAIGIYAPFLVDAWPARSRIVLGSRQRIPHSGLSLSREPIRIRMVCQACLRQTAD